MEKRRDEGGGSRKKKGEDRKGKRKLRPFALDVIRLREQLPLLRDTSVADGHSPPLRAIPFIAIRFTVIA